MTWNSLRFRRKRPREARAPRPMIYFYLFIALHRKVAEAAAAQCHHGIRGNPSHILRLQFPLRPDDSDWSARRTRRCKLECNAVVARHNGVVQGHANFGKKIGHRQNGSLRAELHRGINGRYLRRSSTETHPERTRESGRFGPRCRSCLSFPRYSDGQQDAPPGPLR